MKQQILERARSTVEGFLHRQSAPLTVLAVDPEVNGDGDDLLLIRLTYDDGNDAEGLPGSPALLKLMVRLSTELKDADSVSRGLVHRRIGGRERAGAARRRSTSCR